METFVWLANASSEIESRGLGLNFDLFETNLINLAIVIGILIYFGRGFLGNALGERSREIETAIQEAQQRLKVAQEALSDAQQKLTQAQSEGQRILAQAEEQAKVSKAAILKKSEQDLERLQETATQELDSYRDKAIAELRSRVIAMALEQTEAQLQAHMADPAVQERSIDQSIAVLGG